MASNRISRLPSVDVRFPTVRIVRRFGRDEPRPRILGRPRHRRDNPWRSRFRPHLAVATGEHCQNRALFKQSITSDALDIGQVDACRRASLNEVLAVFLAAAKFNKIVCPHAGGVGLCECVQHLSMIDYKRISASIGDRVPEYTDHLHEHFVDPCVVRDGHYQAPRKPGFSVEMKAASVRAYTFPHGNAWAERAIAVTAP